MTDAIKHIDLDDEQYEDAPKALRDYASKLKKALEAEQARTTTLTKQVASHALGDVLGTQGFKNPKRVEKALLADGIDPLDKSAVESWLEDNADDYAKAESTGESTPEAQQQQVDAETQQGYQKLSGLADKVRQPTDVNALDKAKAKITDDMSPEQVRQVLLGEGL